MAKAEAGGGARCVVCAKPVAAAFAPFCSQGCKDRDLMQWLSDGYRIPGPSALDEAGEGLGRDDRGVAGVDSADDAP